MTVAPGIEALEHAPSPSPRDQRAYRLSSIDMVRGLVIVIMAIDHVRDYFMLAADQDPLANPNVTVGLFLTRWITHFCAPVFVFLAGTSAGLMTARKSPADLARFLLTRGLWLIVVECVIVSTSASFAPGGIPEAGGAVVTVMQVIWAIGASMLVLSVAQWSGRSVCLAVGLGILVAHNLLDAWWPAPSNPLDESWPLWVSMHAQMAHRAGPFLFVFVYPVLPWIGVMLTGFGTSRIFELTPERRNRMLMRSGLFLTIAFVAVRAMDFYGDPNGWQSQPGGLIATAIDFLNTTKYPPSLDFLLMTLGPAAILCGRADRFRGRLKDALIVFGRVPFAFYVTHVLLIHSLSLLLGVAQGFDVRRLMTLFLFYPRDYGVPLVGVYIVWLLVIAVLYPFCLWVSNVKARRKDWWLSYL
ncbi:MAG TPA: heparan-alpha-glucosaminide N-acetyltransferase domain-containing protein [Vicinamibacterales bacterium]|nr:heparan-alpha-glucosaminide N-acetyltransferase domain-containing protein [Vicinamibacterales bacterium]